MRRRKRILDRELPGHRLAYPERHPSEVPSEYRTWAISRERVPEILERQKPGWHLVRPEEFPSEAERALRESKEEENSRGSLLAEAPPEARRGQQPGDSCWT